VWWSHLSFGSAVCGRPVGDPHTVSVVSPAAGSPLHGNRNGKVVSRKRKRMWFPGKGRECGSIGGR